MSAPAGWYSDPSGAPGQRYFDGQQWTQNFAPPAVAPMAVAIAHSGGGGGGASIHVLHAVLTLMTCGLWLSVWLVCVIIEATSRPSSSTVAVSGARPPCAPQQPYYAPTLPPRQTAYTDLTAVGKVITVLIVLAGALFAGLIVLGLVVQHPWLLLPLLPLAGAAGVFFWKYKSAKDRALQERVLAARADYENKLYYEGDPRGTYGKYPPPPAEGEST